jgi:hypothetical protein
MAIGEDRSVLTKKGFLEESGKAALSLGAGIRFNIPLKVRI